MKQQTRLTWKREVVAIEYTDGSTAKFSGSLSENFFIYDRNGPASTKYCATYIPNYLAIFYTDRVSKAKDVLDSLVGKDWYDETIFCTDKSELSKLSKRNEKLRIQRIHECRRFLVDCGVWL